MEENYTDGKKFEWVHSHVGETAMEKGNQGNWGLMEGHTGL